MNIDIKYVSIVLVGLCNRLPLSQLLIGTVVFRKDETGNYQPHLINPILGAEEGSIKKPFKPSFSGSKKGEYVLSFPELGGGHGVMLLIDKKTDDYKFTTGLNRGDQGSSGTISNGAEELAEVLDELFGFTPP